MDVVRELSTVGDSCTRSWREIVGPEPLATLCGSPGDNDVRAHGVALPRTYKSAVPVLQRTDPFPRLQNLPMIRPQCLIYCLCTRSIPGHSSFHSRNGNIPASSRRRRRPLGIYSEDRTTSRSRTQVYHSTGHA